MLKKLILILVFAMIISFPCVSHAMDIIEEETIAGDVVDSDLRYGDIFVTLFTGEWSHVDYIQYTVGDYLNLSYPANDRFVYLFDLNILSYLTEEQKYLITNSLNTTLIAEVSIEYFSDPGYSSTSFLPRFSSIINGGSEYQVNFSETQAQPVKGTYELNYGDYFYGSNIDCLKFLGYSYFNGYGDKLVDMQYLLKTLKLTIKTEGVDKSTADIVVNLGNIEDSINQGFDQMGDKLDGVQDSINQGVENVTNKQDTIIDKISSGFANIGNQVKKAVSDAVTELFVPSEEDMVAQYDKWDSLMADRFGAVYESSQIIDDFVESIKVSDTQDTINFPVVSVDLVGTTFEFGGWEVDVVPDGFQWLVDILKMVSNIGCTVLFINGMRSRYESVVK